MGAVRTRNLEMVRGDTEPFAFEVDGMGGQEFDAVKFNCKKRYGDRGPCLFQLSLGDGITKVREGRYIVRIPPENTQKLAAGDYIYDLRITVNGDVFTIMRGKLKILPNAEGVENE